MRLFLALLTLAALCSPAFLVADPPPCDIALSLTAGATSIHVGNPDVMDAVVSDSSIGGRPWVNLSNALTEDGQYATPLTFLGAYEHTEFLKITFDSLGAPDGANVSVTFRVKRHKSGIAIRDHAARLVLSDSIQSDDYSLTGYWPGTDDWAEYTFTGLGAADVNSGTFGFAISAQCPIGGRFASGTPYIDVIQCVATW